MEKQFIINLVYLRKGVIKLSKYIEKLKLIQGKIIINNNNFDNYFKQCISSDTLLSKIDILNYYKLDLSEFEFINNLTKSNDITENESYLLHEIKESLNQKMVQISLINDKIIKGGKKIDKNTMAYLLKKQEDKELSNTIINVHIYDGAQTIKLKNIIESEK